MAHSLEQLQWHLERYDRQRGSTANRASVVLNAAAILFAGNTFVLWQLLEVSASKYLDWRMLALLLVLSAFTSSLVLFALVYAIGVLVTPLGSRKMFFRDEHVEAALIFNGSDTVDKVKTFAAFQKVLEHQEEAAMIKAAEVELWIGIRQHRYRYERLRRAARYLRYAAISLVFGLAPVLMAYAIVASNRPN